MGKYGEVAIIAVNLIIGEKATDPIEAWQIAVKKIFPDSESSRKKGCPRSTFLGLCESGYIPGVTEGKYTTSVKNKNYAIKALNLLTTNPDLSHDRNRLWDLVIDGVAKQHNSQMDIVLSLWENEMIEWGKL